MKLDSIKAAAAGWLPDALMLGGAGAISYGSGLIYAPAGWIVAGILAVCMGYLLARSGK